nr:hypothetical protein CFP56_09239 [Quercus suber]
MLAQPCRRRSMMNRIQRRIAFASGSPVFREWIERLLPTSRGDATDIYLLSVHSHRLTAFTSNRAPHQRLAMERGLESSFTTTCYVIYITCL